MPERTMNEALDRFEAGVAHIDDLAAEVKRLQMSNDELRRSRRRGRMMLAALGAVVVALGVTVFLTVRGFANARDDDAAHVEQARLEGCRNRNDAAKVTREFAETQFAIFEAATFNQNPTDRQLAILAQLRRAVPQQSDTEFDCNDDGKLDAADYP